MKSSQSPPCADAKSARPDAQPSAQFTPGPWGWFGQGGHDLYLATKHSGRRYVMGFRRMGLQGAQPVFQVNSRMVPASDLLQFEVGDRDVVGLDAAKADDSVYRYDVRGINCADARLIAAAPDLYEALKAAAPLLAAWADDASNDVGACVQEGGKPTEGELNRMRTSVKLATDARAALSRVEGKQ